MSNIVADAIMAHWAPTCMCVCGVVVWFVLQSGLQAPYGRFAPAPAGAGSSASVTAHATSSSISSWWTWTSWGPTIPARWSWVVQESPSIYTSIASFWFFSSHVASSATVNVNHFILSLYVFHYVIRSLVYPFFIRNGQPVPLIVTLAAFSFCIYNGAMQGYYLAAQSPALTLAEAFQQPRFMLGLVVFVAGFLGNQHADQVLRSLRKPGQSGPSSYAIPYGGMFALTSAGNYTCELFEWIGFALMAHTWASWAFVVFTFCNLGPRAQAYHRWYVSKFDDYPRSRTAIVPFLF